MRYFLWPDEQEAVGRIAPADGAGPPLASVALRVNPLAGDPTPRAAPGARIVISSGWVAGSPGDASDGVGFAWGPRARAEFDRWCDLARRELAEMKAMVLLMPAAEHVLSDPQSCLTFLRARAAEPFGLLLDPAALLTQAMLGRAEDHLRRAMEALGRHPALAGVRLTNVAAERAGPGPALRPAPIHRGVLDPAFLASLVGNHLHPDTPVVLLREEVERQMAVLTGAGPGNGG